MVIEKILKQLTPERIKKEVATIQAIELSPELQKWVKEYEKVGERDEFLWKWAFEVSKIITLPNTPKIYCNSLYKTKFLLILFIVLLDDVADKSKNIKLLKEILKIPFQEKYIKINILTNKDKKYLYFTKKAWNSLESTIKKFPLYRKFKPIIRYDFEQILNGMKYAYLLNKNLNLTNEFESRIYLSHNTPAVLSYMIDLTCAPKFNMKNLGFIREIGWYGQLMTRINNWVSTWEREITEQDYTSGIFNYIRKNNKDLTSIEKIKKSKTEENLLKQWEEFYIKLSNLQPKNKEINVKPILKTIKELTVLHLVSKNFI